MFTIVACVCISQDQVLLLRRVSHKSQGDKWGLPAGKPEEQEAYGDAMRRELLEETGITARPVDLVAQGTLVFNRQRPGEYKIVLYSLTIPTKPAITLTDKEHSAYQWLPLEQSIALPDLIADTDTLLKSVILKPA